MEIESVQIDSLSFDSGNVRSHDEKNLDAIAASLDRFGQQKPIVIGANDVVLAGNGTLRAARRLGWDEIEIVRTALKSTEAGAFAIADNRTAELATWDDEELLKSLRELESDDNLLLEATGFDESDLQDLIDAVPIAEEESLTEDSQASDDLLPEDVPAVTERGDVVILGDHELYCGDCIGWLEKIPTDSIDAVVTDPPYGIGYMPGRNTWDCDVPGDDFAREIYRVLKPGGFAVAFAATRTIHTLASVLEKAGLEIRDQIVHLQYTGFPKNQDASRAIDEHFNIERRKADTPATKEAKRFKGGGTALKPAIEPAVLCRKPLEGTLAENLLKWGTGALNIERARYAVGDDSWPGPNDAGEPRYPANVFHCPKPSRVEREQGCEDLPGMSGSDAVNRRSDSVGIQNPRAGAGRTASHVQNHHPTVKPLKLMHYLVKLLVPRGGVVLDPFLGSGTTMIAAEREGLRCIAAEREPSFCDIARARVVNIIEGSE